MGTSCWTMGVREAKTYTHWCQSSGTAWLLPEAELWFDRRQLGPGARAAADRRGDALRAETARRREAQAHWQAHIKGRGLGRAGMVFVP